ncbi:unnamed protein product [Owenia fusiformis]|uniref:Uncharacterized protein n=1 Tax=Owenia fusiformis TaxID=6347 RepID=A0A8S4PQY0_OWEFU|nr:unnamed protein product [Owenia fusiformis]
MPIQHIQLISTSHGRGLKEAMESVLKYYFVFSSFLLFSSFFPGGTLPSIATAIHNLPFGPDLCLDPDLVFVICGGNDIYEKGTEKVRTPLSYFAHSLFPNLISTLRKKFSSSTRICFVGILPRFNQHNFNKKARYVNRRIFELCRQEHLAFLNCERLFLHGNLNSNLFESCYLGDSIHLSNTGCLRLANAYCSALTFILGGFLPLPASCLQPGLICNSSFIFYSFIPFTAEMRQKYEEKRKVSYVKTVTL